MNNMGQSGFVNQVLDNTNKIYQVGFNQFEWWKKVQGTRCQVRRVKHTAQVRSVFGSIASSTLVDDRNADIFNYVVLISLNDMKNIFNKSGEQLQFFDNKNILEIGDIIVFTRSKQEYKYKITEVQTFSEAEGVLYQYTLSGLQEINSTI